MKLEKHPILNIPPRCDNGSIKRKEGDYYFGSFIVSLTRTKPGLLGKLYNITSKMKSN